MDKDLVNYPMDDGSEGVDSRRVLVVLSPSEFAQLETLVDIWNEMNTARGRTKGRRWSKASIAHRFILLEMQAFFERYGGAPTTPEAKAEVTRKAVGDVKKALKNLK